MQYIAIVKYLQERFHVKAKEICNFVQQAI